MVFNSFQFLWLFPIIFLVYYGLCALPRVSEGVRHKVANMSLIVVSYGLYMQWKPAYALLLLGVTAVTYVGARLVEGGGRNKRLFVVVCATLGLLPLLIFKYYNFINETISGLLASCGLAVSIPGLNWAVPIGISFFTFIAVGYLFDVYYGRGEVEKNWWDYMLFVSFFPQILAGPISKAKDLMPQIKAHRHFDYSQAVAGLQYILWGMFLKVVMADRLGLYVDTVFGNWQYNSGITCFVASIAYNFQIYGDFAGYSFMAVGVGRLMGFELINNFRRPYFAVSVTDFWRRWHLSLSIWLRDCVYFPLGGSRCSKARNYCNFLITFFVSGLWHGANWTYITWGMLHGVCLVLEKAFGIRDCKSKKIIVRASRILIAFIVINFIRTVFRMPTISDAAGVIAHIFTQGGSLFLSGNRDVLFSLLAVGIVVGSEFVEEFMPQRFAMMHSKKLVVRWCTYLFLAVSIMVAGVLESGQFIYANF